MFHFFILLLKLSGSWLLLLQHPLHYYCERHPTDHNGNSYGYINSRLDHTQKEKKVTWNKRGPDE